MTVRKLSVAAGLVAAAVLGLWGGAAIAADGKTLADDQCVAQCDEQSDKCMADAGGDASKEKACDAQYDECLRKCG
jgi:hypothetical protein